MPKRFAVSWMPTAVADLDAIISHIARESVSAAERTYARIKKRAASLASMPHRGRIVPELAAHESRSFRETIAEPWRVVYRIDGGTISVTAVLDARRDLEDLLLARFLR